MVEREAAGLDPPARKAVQAEAIMLTVWHRGPAAFGELLRGLRLGELPGSTPIERLLLATWVDAADERGADPRADARRAHDACWRAPIRVIRPTSTPSSS